MTKTLRRLLALVMASATGALEAQDAPVVLSGATVYTAPGETPIRNGVVILEGGKIVAVGASGTVTPPAGATMLRCDGLTIMAGFWNAHVHFAERKWIGAAMANRDELEAQLKQMLTKYGVTYAFDTGSELRNTRALARRITSGEVAGPLIRTTGEIIFPPEGRPPPEILQVLGFTTSRMLEASPATAATAARQLLDGGADGIKLYAATWRPPIVAHSASTIKSVVDVTHARQKLAFAHPSNATGIEAALDGGVDVLVHVAPSAGPWSLELIERMKKQHVVLIPTLKLWEWEGRHDTASQFAEFIALAVAQLRTYWQAGGTIVFGTDVGYVDDYDPTREFQLMGRAGMDVPAILASLTTNPARVFGTAAHTGRISEGFDADLVVLQRDPANDLSAFSDVRYTIRGGRIIYDAKR